MITLKSEDTELVMKSVRIQPGQAGTLFVDVVCTCGASGLKNEATGMASFKHLVLLGGKITQQISCLCGRRYELKPQTDHVHISQL